MGHPWSIAGRHFSITIVPDGTITITIGLQHLTTSLVFSENMGHPQPIKVVINKVSQITETENLWYPP